MAAIYTVNLAVTFLLELAMLAALAYWGFTLDTGMVARIALGLSAPSIAALVWSQIMAPKAKWRLTGIFYLAVKLVLFGAATLALWIADQHTFAIIFGVTTVINQIIQMALGGQVETASPQ